MAFIEPSQSQVTNERLAEDPRFYQATAAPTKERLAEDEGTTRKRNPSDSCSNQTSAQP